MTATIPAPRGPAVDGARLAGGVVDAIAASARGRGLLWDARAGRWFAVAVAGALTAVTIALALRHGPGWTSSAAVCLDLAMGWICVAALLTWLAALPAPAAACCAYAVVA
ncbi:hypothetical protein ND748_33060, partial [Frankia sp. AiPs1]|nr:hypothetical protein [Frankia sp. AiPs1]